MGGPVRTYIYLLLVISRVCLVNCITDCSVTRQLTIRQLALANKRNKKKNAPAHILDMTAMIPYRLDSCRGGHAGQVARIYSVVGYYNRSVDILSKVIVYYCYRRC